MSKRLSFSIAVNLLTENFKKGTNTVKNSLRSMQMQVLTFAAALGAGGLGISGLITRFKDVARETSRVITALKNVSDGTKGFAENLRFVNDLANKYGLEVNALTGNFTKFTASATQANMPMEQQTKVFESLSRATSAFALSAEETDGVFLALSQMMGKGKISSEELRKQMGEKLPIAMQAMAKAAGVSMAELEKLLKQGKLMSADMIPKFADALNEMIPNVDTNNLEASLNRLSNVFGEIVNASGAGDKYKALIDGLTSLLQTASENIKNIIVGIVAAIGFVVTKGIKKNWGNYSALAAQMEAHAIKTNSQLLNATQARIAAEVELEKAKHALINATDSQRLATKQRLASAEVALTQAKITEEKAIEATKNIAIQASDAQILANKQATAKAYTTIVQKRIAAELELEEAKLAALIASDNERLASAQRLKQAKAKLAKLTNQEIAAQEAARVAASQASLVIPAKTASSWNRAFATMRAGAAKLAVSIRGLWTSFAPAIIISGLIAVIGYFKNIYDETKRIKKIFSDYKNGAKDLSNTKEVVQLKELQKMANNINASYEDRKTAIDLINKKLETNYSIDKNSLKINGDINAKIAERIKLLEAQAKVDYYTESKVKAEDDLKKTYRKHGGESEFNNKYLDAYRKNEDAILGYTGFGAIAREMEETVQFRKIIADAEKEMVDALNYVEKNTSKTTPTTPPAGDPDNISLRAAEKRLEALRKLDEEDRKRQIEKQKFDLDLQQKAIDTMDDNFEKRTKQTILNLEKEKLAIEEHQSKLLKDQQEHLKTKYVSVSGTDKGFGEYFKQAQANNFKDGSGISILPEGLRPEDIESQVGELLGAAQNAQRKGLADINKDLSTMLLEQQNMFKSDKDKKLSDLDAYYNNEKKKLGERTLENADYYDKITKQIEDNRTREKKQVTTDDDLKKIDFDEQLELERIAGMESIGMAELVEEKKLEITRESIQLRIDALQVLADAGDEDAKRQIQLYEASLKKLDSTKTGKSLKSLADKAIFDVIKKGFEKAGDSAEEAEEKTTKLMGSISAKAGMVANITKELQSMFGGMDEGLDMALETVGNIAQGFATGGIVGGAMAVIGEGMRLFSKASEAAARHQKALKEIAEARLASQRAYNLLLRDQNLLLEEAVSIFGEKQITRAANAIKNYRESLKDIEDEKQGDFAPDAAREQYLEKGASSGGIMGAYFSKKLKDYKKQLDNYNKGIAKLADQKIVTGHKKTGLFGWGKGKSTYSSILDVPEYKDLIKANGKLDKEMLQTIINTRKMSDETKAYLQNLLNLEDAAEAAQEELRNYLQSTFGVLGDDIMNSIENAIINKGVNAWEEFGKAGAKVIENLGKQIAYELFFADKFKQLQKDLEAVYGSNKSEEDIARESMDLVGKFYQNIGENMELAQGFMENWQKEAEKYGLELWNNSTSQSGSKGYSVSMDQDTGDKILGRVTAMQMSGLKMEGLLSVISIATANIFKQSTNMNSEMEKQTTILNNIYQVQRNSFFEVEGTGRYLKDMSGKLANIETYTKALE